MLDDMRCPECGGELVVSPWDDDTADCVGENWQGGCASAWSVRRLARYYEGLCTLKEARAMVDRGADHT